MEVVDQNELLENMEKMLTSKLEAFQESQRDYSQAQFSRIQQSLSLNDGYTYRKKGNEEQHKVNVRVLDKLKEADVFLQDAARATPSEAVSTAQQKVTEGLSLKTCIDEEIQQSGTQHASFDELSSKMAYFLTLSKSNSTTIKYYSYFKKWVSFISSKGGSPIPASPIHVALYLTDLIDKQSPHSVISSTVYSIKWAHSLKNLPDPTDNMFVTNLVESSKRTLSKPLKKKEPITTDVLISLCEKYTVCTDVLVIRDLTMILLAYSGFLRFDELSRLHCSDIQIHENHISVHIRKSKTDQYRQGNTIVISKGDTVASPYNMLKRYLQVTGLSVKDDVFLFKPCFRSKNISKLIYKNKPLSYTRARECLISRLREIVGDSNIGLHSLRAGGATMAANAGVNDRCWKRHGRWKGENSKDGYVADSLERRLEVSKSLAL